MQTSRLGWACWALVPVVALAIHFGPGQAASARDRAASAQSAAIAAEREAAQLQADAYAVHRSAIEARQAALLSGTPADAARAAEATAAEEHAYALAATAWKGVADLLGEVIEELGDAAPEQAREMRAARARALVRSGEIWPGIEELEQVVAALDDEGRGDSPLALGAREELATAFYFGARLLRLSGLAPQEWMVESGKARQQFRYLAERARRVPPAAGAAAGAAAGPNADGSLDPGERHQRNLEIVLNLEQASLVELQARPLPKDSPCQGNLSNRACTGKKPGKKPGQRKDGRGAGGAEPVTEGW